jgi:hypothetical protein
LIASPLGEVSADAADVIDMDDAFASGGADQVAQQCLPVLNRAAPQIVAIDVQHSPASLATV